MKFHLEDDYLGDGVYASFDGYQIVLDLRGQDNTTRIALEPIAFKNLLSYGARVDEEVQKFHEAALREMAEP